VLKSSDSKFQIFDEFFSQSNHFKSSDSKFHFLCAVFESLVSLFSISDWKYVQPTRSLVGLKNTRISTEIRLLLSPTRFYVASPIKLETSLQAERQHFVIICSAQTQQPTIQSCSMDTKRLAHKWPFV
jgi:hypothetical protein